MRVARNTGAEQSQARWRDPDLYGDSMPPDPHAGGFGRMVFHKYITRLSCERKTTLPTSQTTRIFAVLVYHITFSAN